ncbi:MAG: hypothetical protein GC134_03945 [Proteobacteria bacterium]|nr:hypothetical protein [Pseudomonadota bacterium]
MSQQQQYTVDLAYLAPRAAVQSMEAHVPHLTGQAGWRQRNEEAFAAHKGLRFFVFHPLDHVNRAAMALDSKRLKADVGDFLARSGAGAVLKPDSVKHYEQDLQRRVGFAYYSNVDGSLRPGVNLDPDAQMPVRQDFASLVSAMQANAKRTPIIGGVINSYDPMMTRQEIVASFAYGDMAEAENVPFLLPFQLTDMHRYVDAHERFHGSFRLKSEHMYTPNYFSGQAAEMVAAAQHEKNQRVGNEWSTPYGKYIEENVVDSAAMLLHLQEGGDPAFISLIADTRASALDEVGDFDHDTADALYALAEKGRDKYFVEGLKHLDIHELTDVAVRHVADHIRSKEQHYGMMKYAAMGQATFGANKARDLLDDVEKHLPQWAVNALPMARDKDAWHACRDRADQAQDRLEDTDQKFARCQTFFPQLRDMDPDQQEAFMMELEERALMQHLTEEYPHLDNAADRKMLLDHRRERIMALNGLDDDQRDYFDMQLDVLDVMCKEEEVLMDLEAVCELDDSYRTPEGEAHFLRAKVREAEACSRGGDRPMVEAEIIEGLMARRQAAYAQIEQTPAHVHEGLGR